MRQTSQQPDGVPFSGYARLRRFARICLVSGGLTLGLLFLAMILYAEPYEICGDYLSAMGRTHIHEGKLANYPACIAFTAGLVIAGFATGAYFFLRGFTGKKLTGIPLMICGSLGGMLLAVTGLIPFDVWADGHNFSIYIAAGLISVCLLLCGLQGSSVFSSRENNISWLCMTVFVGLCWAMLSKLSALQQLAHAGVIQQKLITSYLWIFLIRHALLLQNRCAEAAEN